MTSAINYASINENFPVAGQDNDTQVFRDNFDTIKTSLYEASREITDLQNNTAKTNELNDFGNNQITRAILKNNWDFKTNGSSTSEDIEISLGNGPYQIWTIASDINVTFSEFPTNTDPLLPMGVGKVTLELYSDGSSRIATFISEGGSVFKKLNWPTAGNTLTLTSNDDPVIIEMWQHSSDIIFLNYIGQFS